MPSTEERYPYPDETGDEETDQANRDRIDAERAEYDKLSPAERAVDDAAKALLARGFTAVGDHPDDGLRHEDGHTVRIVAD